MAGFFMPDLNYVSLSGQPDGELWLVDYRRPPAETIHLLRNKGDLTPLTYRAGDIKAPQGKGWTDALKLSGAVNLTVAVDELEGGYEDCVDINHSHNVAVEVQRATPHGKFVLTCKGGSTDVKLSIAEQHGHGTETDLDLGNWADQWSAKTGPVSLYSKTTDGSAVRVRRLNAEHPELSHDCRWELTDWMAPFFLPVMRILKLLRLA